MNEIKAGDVCIFRRLRIAVLVELVDSADRTTVCRTLSNSVNYKAGFRFFPPLDELVTVEQFCEEWSDFMTFAAHVMNQAPQDEPVNKSSIWAFFDVGRMARLHLLKWNIRQQL